MLRQLRSAAIAVVVFTVLLGLAYPLAITGLAQLFWRHEANGSQVYRGGRLVGSLLMGQGFAGESRYFQSRPSASGYEPTLVAASNLGPNSARLSHDIRTRLSAFVRSEGVYDRGLTAASVPPDAVTASGSGVDPDISVADARIQAHRVAAVRHLALDTVLNLIASHTDGSPGGLFGPGSVNVLALNLALDAERAP